MGSGTRARGWRSMRRIRRCRSRVQGRRRGRRLHCRCWVVGARQQGPEQNHGQGPEDHRSDAGRRRLHHRAHSRSGVICRRRWTDRRRADDGHGLDLVLQPLHVLDCLLQRRGVVGLQIINVVAHAKEHVSRLKKNSNDPSRVQWRTQSPIAGTCMHQDCICVCIIQ
jgi:hypothetical protein